MKISFIITHYNRPDSLKKCISSIHNSKINCEYEVVVSDDCSEDVNVLKIKKFDIDKLILSEVNTGLASNNNRGLKACEGDFIVYIQEDFILNKEFSNRIYDIISVLEQDNVDMIRFRSNVKFKKYKLLNNYFKVLPRFAFKNFLIDQYRYSDHPFIVRNDFFKKFGYFKCGASTNYGENEYMIRMMKLNPKIALCSKDCVYSLDIEGSVREENHKIRRKRLRNNRKFKPVKRIVNAFRFKLEFMLYNTKNRNLLTFKNLRAS